MASIARHPVDIFVFGDNVWRHEAAWPLARAVPTNWYVTSGGNANTSGGDGVLDTLPPTGAAADTFTYNPASPTPFLIDSRELETSLNEDYTDINAARHDELVFTSKPLTKPIEVTGQMSATLWAATRCPGYRLERDVARCLSGRSCPARAGRSGCGPDSGMASTKKCFLTPGSVERYDLDVWYTSRVFEPGHRIRVTISSALFPKYDRNLNTGGNNERDTTFVSAHQRLVHDAAHPTHIVLPVIPR